MNLYLAPASGLWADSSEAPHPRLQLLHRRRPRPPRRPAAKANIASVDNQYANVEDSMLTRLKSASAGLAKIVYKEPGIGEKLGIVALGDVCWASW